MDKKKFIYSLFVLLTLFSYFLTGCTNDKNSESTTTEISDASNNKQEVTKGEDAKIFILPAPLQIATALKTLNTGYSETLLMPSKKYREYSSNYLRAVNLGIYTIDLGYATVYGQNQTCLNYAKVIQAMTKDLGITSSIHLDMVKRFENNIQNKDSLYQIILESYSEAHNYFQNNQREDVGFFILSGSFIEGLYLSLNNKAVLKNVQLQNLVGQQKLFLENIMELLQYMDKNEYATDLNQKLQTLKKEYDLIEVAYGDSENGKTAIRCNITQEQLTKLLNKVTEVRNKLTRV